MVLCVQDLICLVEEHGKPSPVFVMDKPSLGLAPLAVRDIFSIIRDLKSEGTTILIIEQNANTALRCAEQAYVLVMFRY